jgi:5-hydroxyisourate hydrolase-like protein (transthyretin family)
VAVRLEWRAGDGPWAEAGAAATDADGRCSALPAPDVAARQARLCFDVAPYLARTHGAGFFPEVTAAFAVEPGAHYHVPLLLSPYGYSVYRGS